MPKAGFEPRTLVKLEKTCSISSKLTLPECSNCLRNYLRILRTFPQDTFFLRILSRIHVPAAFPTEILSVGNIVQIRNMAAKFPGFPMEGFPTENPMDKP
ncbi:hypothetical protein MTR_8g054280 [Medicago truncatula]|uniref:Uncharacterized protein n=1 Tax=Medicago truncatula TaxID=3880 RepID=G7LA45_MEDTR|nr:hypothetical protein MTR_8g054280 [Medicago truncatula]